MCEYQKVTEGELPVCEYTGRECTLCVLGNSRTYNQAKINERNTINVK